VEHARNVAGIDGAGFEEGEPGASALIITRLACSLQGLEQEILIVPGTLAAQAYGVERAIEKFLCRFGPNEAYRERLFSGDLRVSGTDAEGNVRMAELVSHPFFVGTLFVPQCSSEPEGPHPLIVAFVRAAAAFHTRSRQK
jgi:CTP synthase (UTP-ammonia lyase)